MICLARDRDVAVSIVVPVYNTSEYLPRCLDSLLGQTLRKIEVIAVNDASTDGSAETLLRYERRDRRIRLVQHERNQGLHIARISGVLASSGHYIGYVDSDDYVSSDMFESMYRCAIERRADVVRMGAWLLPDGLAPISQREGSCSTLSFSSQEHATGVNYIDSDFYPAMWLHLHRRELWRLALPHFPRIRLLGEDNLTSFVLAFFAGTVVSMPDVGYCYVTRKHSLSAGDSLANILQHITDRAGIVRLLRQFVVAADGRGEPGWASLAASNRSLLFSYIDSLNSPADRMQAVAVFESAWLEQVPPERKAAWFTSERGGQMPTGRNDGCQCAEGHDDGRR